MQSHQKYSVNQVLTAIRDANGLLSLAARQLGCDRRTVYNYIERHPSLAVAVKDERESFVDVAEQRLRKAVEHDEAWAIALVIKTLGRHRGYVDRGSSSPEPLSLTPSLEASEEWLAIKRTLLEVLQQHPAALADVSNALNGMATSGNGHHGNGHGVS
jgi:hypothetical protein